MRTMVLLMAVILTLTAGTVSEAAARANERAPCIGENASTFAPALGRDFGQVIVAPEARAGLTGETASSAARRQTDCLPAE